MRRSVPAAVWLISVLWAVTMAGTTLLWPASYGLDEPQHLDLAYAYSHSLHLYAPGERRLSAAVLAVQQSYRGFPPQGPLGDSPVAGRGARPTLAELGPPDRPATDPAVLPNQMVQHPPAYYLLAAGVLRLPGVSALAFDRQIGLVRLLSLLLLLPVPALCWATARRLGVAPPAALVAAALPVGLPGLARIGGAVTNDSLLILLTSVLTYLLARVLTGDLGRRTAAAVAGVLALDLLTKGLALVLPPVVLLGYLAGGRRSGRRLPVAPLVIAGAGAVVGGLWWLRNVILYHAVQPSGFGPGVDLRTYGAPRAHGGLLSFLPSYLDGTAKRIWGELGFPEPPASPAVLSYGWLVLAGTGLLAALLLRRPPPLTRTAAGLLTLPAVLALALTGTQAAAVYRRYGVLAGVQGRYGYLGLVGIAVLVGTGLTQLTVPLVHRLLPAGTLAAALLTQASGFLLVADSWWGPDGGGPAGTLRQAGSAILRVSPWPPPVTLLPLAVLAGLALAALARAARRRLLQAAWRAPTVA